MQKMPLLIYRISSIIYSSCTKFKGIISVFHDCIYKKTTKNTQVFDILLTRKMVHERLAVYFEKSFTTQPDGDLLSGSAAAVSFFMQLA